MKTLKKITGNMTAQLRDILVWAHINDKFILDGVDIWAPDEILGELDEELEEEYYLNSDESKIYAFDQNGYIKSTEKFTLIN